MQIIRRLINLLNLRFNTNTGDFSGEGKGIIKDISNSQTRAILEASSERCLKMKNETDSLDVQKRNENVDRIDKKIDLS